MSVIDVKTTDVIQFVAGKSVFYLDGKMYYFLEDNVRKPGVRGTANFARWDIEDSSLVLMPWSGLQTSVPLSEQVTWCEDVGLLEQKPGDNFWQRNARFNKLHRYSRAPRADVSAWRQMRRVVMGVVDYKIMRDNYGLTTRDKYDGLRVKSESSITLVDEGFGRGKPAWVFEFVNDDSPTKAKSIVLPHDHPWVWAGPWLSFSSDEADQEGRGFV